MPKQAELSKKLGSQPSWKDTIAPTAEPVKKSKSNGTSPSKQKMIRKTYLLYQNDIDRVAQLAQDENVGINELTRYLLNLGCELVESGQHQLPTTTQEVRKIVT